MSMHYSDRYLKKKKKKKKRTEEKLSGVEDANRPSRKKRKKTEEQYSASPREGQATEASIPCPRDSRTNG